MNVVKLSEICTFTRGLTYSKTDEVELSRNIVLRANNIDLDTNSLNFDDLRYISDSFLVKEEKLVKKGSLIICTASGSKAHVGKVALIDQDYGYAFGGFMGQLTPSDQCDPKFLYYVLTSRSFKDFLMTLNDGANINNLKFGDIANYLVFLPPMENQLEIVEKLDSLFSELDLVEENHFSLLSLIESLLKSSLSIPYEGAKSKSSKLFRLDDIAVFQGGSQPAKTNFIYEERQGYVRFLQIRDFASDKNLTYIPESRKNRLCTESDIMIGRYGASVGKVLTGLAGAYNVALMKITPNEKFVKREYLHFYLLSNLFQDSLLSVSDRSAQNGFSKDDIGGFLVNVPDLDEQERIVAKLSAFFAGVDSFRTAVQLGRTKLLELRKSILDGSLEEYQEVA